MSVWFGRYWRNVVVLGVKTSFPVVGREPSVADAGRSPPALFSHAVEPLGRIHVTIQSFALWLRPATRTNAVVFWLYDVVGVVSDELVYAVAWAKSIGGFLKWVNAPGHVPPAPPAQW